MRLDMTKSEQVYKMIVKIKALGPKGQAFVNGSTLFNQKVLTACGQIHASLMQLSEIDAKSFKDNNKEFFGGFTWVYYMDWRQQRAKSCAHLLNMYKLLNVTLGVQHFVGETFFAGIPVVTVDEIEEVIKTQQVGLDGVTPIDETDESFCHEKIGIDGQLHKTDKYGEFEPWKDTEDIYGDNTNVTLAELKAVTTDKASPCLSCKWDYICNSQCNKGCESYEKKFN